MLYCTHTQPFVGTLAEYGGFLICSCLSSIVIGVTEDYAQTEIVSTHRHVPSVKKMASHSY